MINEELFTMQPFAHQRRVLEETIDKTHHAYFMDMGTGKSKLAIDLCAQLYDRGEIKAALFVAPNAVIPTWLKEQFPQHLHFEKTNAYITTYRSTPTKALQEEWREISKHDGLRILVMNTEAFVSKSASAFASNFLRHSPSLMIVDESTMVKNRDAVRTKELQKIAKHAKYMRIMTGNPMPNGVTDLFAQLQFLSKAPLGFPNYYAFRNRFCLLEKQHIHRAGKLVSFDVIVGTRDTDLLSERLRSCAHIVNKKECLDLPAKVYQTRYIRPTAEQLKHYNDLVEYHWTQNKGQDLTVSNGLSFMGRVHMILCGHMPTDTGDRIPLKNNRLPALMEVLQDVKGKSIIWANYTADILSIFEAIKTEYGLDSVVLFYGETSEDDRAKAVEEFQRGTARFFVSNQATGRFGLTLTAATTVIYYSNSYNLEHREQSEDRAHRAGQTESVTYIDILVENTVDVDIVEALREKKEIANIVLRRN